MTLKAVLTVLALTLLDRWDARNKGKIDSIEFFSNVQCLSCACFGGGGGLRAPLVWWLCGGSSVFSYSIFKKS